MVKQLRIIASLAQRCYQAFVLWFGFASPLIFPLILHINVNTGHSADQCKVDKNDNVAYQQHDEHQGVEERGVRVVRAVVRVTVKQGVADKQPYHQDAIHYYKQGG